MGLGSWSAASKSPLSQQEKPFFHCGRAVRKTERVDVSFDVRHGVLVERGFPSFLCATVCSENSQCVDLTLCMREEGGVKLF